MKETNVKLLIMDVDGTLLNDQKQITERTKKALIQLQQEGIMLGIASGRPVKGLQRFAQELRMPEFGGILISSNGARAETLDGNVLFENPIPLDLAHQVLEHLKKFNVRPMVEDGDYMQVNNVYNNLITTGDRTFNAMDYEAHSNGFLLKESHDLCKSVKTPPCKILTAGDDTYLQEHYKEMEAPFADVLDCMFTAPFYFEYTNKDINKGTAISHLPYQKEEIASIGDAQNDISMLKSSSIGVAMGNAVDETKAVADYVTADNNNDGIALWIEDFFGIKPDNQ